MKTSLSILHHQGNDWLRQLQFYKDELTILTTRLQQAANSNTSAGIKAQVEHFQNKFILLRERLDTLNHQIGARNHEVEKMAASKPQHTEEKFVRTSNTLHGEMKDFTGK